MKITVGESRRSVNWKRVEISEQELADKTARPVITGESFDEYLKLSKAQQDEIKDVGGFVGGVLSGNRRRKNTVEKRTMLTLDADNIPSEVTLEEIVGKVRALKCNFIIYSTRKHTAQAPRVRILIPLAFEIPPEWYEPAVRKLCQILGMEYFDPTTVEAHRLMYWPSVSRDSLDNFYYRSELKRENLFVDEILFMYPDQSFLSREYWPRFPGETVLETGEKERQQDPLTKDGVIGAFCRTYSVQEAIEAFLPDVYERVTDTRYTYKEGSSAGGLLIYEGGKFAYSHHATDPACDKCCNAFDLVRIHKFGDSEGSLGRMIEFAGGIDEVQEKVQEESLQKLLDNIHDFDAVYGKESKNAQNGPETEDKSGDSIEDEDFTKRLKRDKKGAILKTIENIHLILTEDPNLKSKYHYDLFSEYMVVDEPLPWQGERECPRLWNDTDDAGCRWYLESVYGITGKEKIMDALAIAFSENAVHPVKNYLEGLEWDGEKRLDTLLVDYFGAKDDIYTRHVTRKSLIAAVARIYEPGIKFDYMTILIGSQGIGKSTLLAKLGKDWFSDSLVEFSGKDAYEILQNSWIIEVGELSGFNRYEVNQIKQFLTKQKDDYRAAYARRKETHLRQCVIFGTTNEDTFLRDETGNRRFWPVPLEENYPTKDFFDEFTDEIIDQIWAEAYQGYLNGESLFLEDPKAKQLAEIQQKLRTEVDPREGQIIEYLKREIPEDWYKRSVEEQRTYWMSPEADPVETVQRDRICADEIYVVLWGKSYAEFKNYISKEINKIFNGIVGLTKKAHVRCGDYGNIKGAYMVTEDFYKYN